MAIHLPLPVALLALSFGFLGLPAPVAAQDPANVDAAPAADPARVGAAVRGVRSGRSAPPAPASRPDMLRRLQSAEDLQRRLSAQLNAGQALPPDQRTDMQQLLDRSSGLISESWDKLGRRTARTGSAAPQPAEAAQLAPMLDSLASLQDDPRVREGAQQAREAMEAMQRTLLPMLQELRDEIDAELRAASNRSR